MALLATIYIYPSGIAKTAIDGWDEEWHNCVYINFPWGQASWLFYDDEMYLFEKLSRYEKIGDGHSTEGKIFKNKKIILTPIVTYDKRVS